MSKRWTVPSRAAPTNVHLPINKLTYAPMPIWRCIDLYAYIYTYFTYKCQRVRMSLTAPR